MSNPATIVGDIMALLQRGTVTLDLSNPVTPADESARFVTPYVYVTSEGKTWRQPLRRAIGQTQSSPEEVAEALGVALDRVLRPARSPEADGGS